MLTHKYTRYLDQSGEDGPMDGETGEPIQSPEVDEIIAKLKQENQAMQNKVQELLTETKRAKESKREAELRIKQEQEEKARRAGDFEQLHKSSEAERERLQQELEALRGSIAKEKEQSTAMKIAAELAEGANAEILSEFVARRLKYTDEGIRVTDNNGDLTVSSLDQLKAEFQSNARFAALLRGTQASGGGALGSTSSASASDKVMTRAEFAQLSPDKQMSFVKEKGKLVD